MSTTTIQNKQKGLAPKKLTENQAAKLASLTQVAKQARGAYYSPEVEQASRQLSKLLFTHLENGVRYADLSDATGLKWRSIKARLFRHGYIHPVPPSQQDKVFKGPKKPGPKCDHDPSRYRERKNKQTGKVVHVECLDCRRNKRMADKESNAQSSAA